MELYCGKDDGKCLRCGPGLYGDFCEKNCSSNCIGGYCSLNGTCPLGCKSGWKGLSCIEPTGISLVLIVVMSVCGLVIFLLVFVFISCACR